LSDPRVLALAATASLSLDAAAPAEGDLIAGTTTLRLRNGHTLQSKIVHPLGSPNQPLSEAQLIVKFKDCAAHARRLSILRHRHRRWRTGPRRLPLRISLRAAHPFGNTTSDISRLNGCIPMASMHTTAPQARTLVRASLLMALLAPAVSALAMAADPAPSGLAACVSETDPGKRLEYYDRASGRDHQGPPTPATVAPAPPSPAATPAPAQVPKQMIARVIGIKRVADGYVLRLDNGQVWQNVDSTPPAIDLKVGDQITLERSLGSYWLSGRNGAALQVTQKREPSTAP
jgi:hypothetical protein